LINVVTNYLSNLRAKWPAVARSIQWRLFWLWGGTSVALVVAVNLIWLPSAIREVERSHAEVQEIAVQSVHDQVRQFIEDVAEGLKNASLQFQVAEVAGDADASPQIGQNIIQRQPAFEEIGLINADGKEIMRISRRIAAADLELRDRSASSIFIEGKRREVYWGPVVIAETSEPMVTLAMRVGSGNPESAGVAYAVINLKRIWNMVSEFKLGREGRVVVVDGSGRLIAASDLRSVLRQTSLADRSVVQELVSGKASRTGLFARGVYSDERGVMVDATGLFLDPPAWGILIEQPKELLYASVREKVWFFIGLSGLGLLLSLLLAHFISRRFTGPISRLRQGVEELAAGRLGCRVIVESSDEIGDVAAQINRMAEALQNFYRELEEKVSLRTRELSTLYGALTPLAGSESVHQLFDRVIERLISATGADAVAIRLMDREQNKLVVLSQRGFSPAQYSLNQAMPEGLADRSVFDSAEPIISSNIAEDKRIHRKKQVEFGFNSCAFLPLSINGEVRGIIHLAARDLGYFREEQKDYLMAIARLMGIVAGNSELLQSSLRIAEELKRSNQELQQFAYVASHDLQEPLRMVIGYTGLLAKRYKGKLDQEADEFIGFAADGAKRMHALINDLLEYSRVESRGKEFAPTDCEEVLAVALTSLRMAIHESGAQVTHDPLPTVMADESQLRQLFQNLIGNGIKYQSGAPPRVHISCVRDGQSWLFSVKDNGIGIDAQYAERIFVIFQRLHTQKDYPGTGIGLAICKKLVERHGGKIWVESAPGQGATFYFTIPVRSQVELSAVA
jgi:signal transduction histidine kinase